METLELHEESTYDLNYSLTGTYEVLNKGMQIDGGFIVTLIRCTDTRDLFLILED